MSVSFRNTLRWPVHVRGYEWRTRSSLGLDESLSDSRDEWMLVPHGAETKTYNPKEHPDLFRKFANLDGSAESILEFANDHGRMVEEGTDGESIAFWQQEIQVMNRVLTAWDFLTGRSTLKATELVRRVWTDEMRLGDEERLRGFWLRARLAGFIKAALNPPPFSFQANTVTELSARSHALLLRQVLAWDDTRRVFQWEIQTATCLLLVLWSQAGEALTGVRDFRKCAYAKCSEMIEVSRDPRSGHTARAEYHSDSCRALASRMRRSKPKRKKQPKG
jgi:hypothetical protein